MIENPDESSCSTSTCSPFEDGKTCCKPAPPALCSSITGSEISTFCANDGANGLIPNPAAVSCKTTTCTIVADAAHCCKAAADAAKCNSIQSPDTFCNLRGSAGLVDNPQTVTCATSTCTIDADLDKCCKKCGAGRFLKKKGPPNCANNDCPSGTGNQSYQNGFVHKATTDYPNSGCSYEGKSIACMNSDGNYECCGDPQGQDDYICEACEIGQFSAAGGASECLSSCPAGYGADATIPIYMNVFFMLDMTGSVCEQWVEEVEAAEAYCAL